MDKHDRPYICTEPGCEKIRGFTYSGGLLRHQREVHKKHGGPKTALMCLDPHCKRSTGVGFTRKENLVEHERRVHRKDALGQSSTNQYIHQHRKVAVSDDKDGEDGTSTRKRKRSVDDVQWTPAGFVKEEGGGDLRDEVKRLKRENEEKDRKLKNLEAFVAGLKQSMQAHSSSS